MPAGEVACLSPMLMVALMSPQQTLQRYDTPLVLLELFLLTRVHGALTRVGDMRTDGTGCNTTTVEKLLHSVDTALCALALAQMHLSMHSPATESTTELASICNPQLVCVSLSRACYVCPVCPAVLQNTAGAPDNQPLLTSRDFASLARFGSSFFASPCTTTPESISEAISPSVIPASRRTSVECSPSSGALYRCNTCIPGTSELARSAQSVTTRYDDAMVRHEHHALPAPSVSVVGCVYEHCGAVDAPAMRRPLFPGI